MIYELAIFAAGALVTFALRDVVPFEYKNWRRREQQKEEDAEEWRKSALSLSNSIDRCYSEDADKELVKLYSDGLNKVIKEAEDLLLHPGVKYADESNKETVEEILEVSEELYSIFEPHPNDDEALLTMDSPPIGWEEYPGKVDRLIVLSEQLQEEIKSSLDM